MVKLDKQVASTLCGGQDLSDVERLEAKQQSIDKVSVLSAMPKLLRLDLTGNALASFAGLTAHTSLKWLSLASNAITTVPALEFPELQVLNVGGNQVSGKLRIQGMPKLRALIANDNAITAVKGLRKLLELNTVILKHNSVTELAGALRGCAALVKLSMAHNELSSLGAGDLAGCTALTELRLGHNELRSLPPELAACSRLKIVDLGANRIRSLDDIKVLQRLPLLQQLTLHGCPCAEAEGFQAALLQLLPLVEILDGKRVKGRIKGRLMGEAQQEQVAGGDEGVEVAVTAQPGLKRRRAIAPEPMKTKASPAAGGEKAPGVQLVEKKRKSAVAAAAVATAAAPQAAARQVARAAAEAAAAAAEVSDESDSDDEQGPARIGGEGGKSFLAEMVFSRGSEGTQKSGKSMVGGIGYTGKDRKGGIVNSSGVVAVIDVRSKASRQGKKARQERNGKAGVVAEASASVVRGAAVAKLLVSGLGLNALDAGSGLNGTSWD